MTALEVAGAAAGVGLLNFATKFYFDARDALWKRAQWAMDKATSTESDLERKVGLQAMAELLEDKRLRTKDVKLMKSVMLTVAEEARRELRGTSEPPATDTEEPGRGPA